MCERLYWMPCQYYFAVRFRKTFSPNSDHPMLLLAPHQACFAILIASVLTYAQSWLSCAPPLLPFALLICFPLLCGCSHLQFHDAPLFSHQQVNFKAYFSGCEERASQSCKGSVYRDPDVKVSLNQRHHHLGHLPRYGHQTPVKIQAMSRYSHYVELMGEHHHHFTTLFNGESVCSEVVAYPAIIPSR